MGTLLCFFVITHVLTGITCKLKNLEEVHANRKVVSKIVGSRDGALGLGKSCFVRAMLSFAQAVRDFVTAMRNGVAAKYIKKREWMLETRD